MSWCPKPFGLPCWSIRPISQVPRVYETYQKLRVLWACKFRYSRPAPAPRILVGFPPGSAPDIVARLLGQQLSDRLGQPFVIDNRPGASSNIATEAVVHAAP